MHCVQLLITSWLGFIVCILILLRTMPITPHSRYLSPSLCFSHSFSSVFSLVASLCDCPCTRAHSVMCRSHMQAISLRGFPPNSLYPSGYNIASQALLTHHIFSSSGPIWRRKTKHQCWVLVPLFKQCTILEIVYYCYWSEIAFFLHQCCYGENIEMMNDNLMIKLVFYFNYYFRLQCFGNDVCLFMLDCCAILMVSITYSSLEIIYTCNDECFYRGAICHISFNHNICSLVYRRDSPSNRRFESPISLPVTHPLPSINTTGIWLPV